MILAIDIGNTHTDLGLGNLDRITRVAQVRTQDWRKPNGLARVESFVGRRKLKGIAISSVVPDITPRVMAALEKRFGVSCVCLSNRNVVGLGIDYPKPQSIGADRLANAMAALQLSLIHI